jgi:NADPH2:quinone reductase
LEKIAVSAGEEYRRVVVTRFGGSDVLALQTVPLDEPGPREVRLKVLKVGVSFADLLMREGVHPEVWFQKPPFTLGWDVIGIIDRLGSEVSGWQVGQRAAALPVKGGYAEYLCLAAEELIPAAEELDDAEVLCMVYNYAVAYQMLHRIAKVKAGEHVLIHSAAGGVGSALVELGRLAGLKLYGTASAAKHALLDQAGCIPIDYKSVDFVAAIWQLTEGNGVDVVFDGIGGTHLRRSYAVLKPGGRLIAYGLSASLPTGRVSRWRVILMGLIEWLYAFLPNLIPGGRSVHLYSIQTLKRRRPNWYREDAAILLQMLKEGKLKPIIADCLPLEEAARAHDLLAAGHTSGKVVLKTDKARSERD